MKIRNGVVLALVIVSSASAVAWADGPMARLHPSGAVDLDVAKPATPPLPQAKKLESVNLKVRALGIGALGALPPAQMKVAPIAPTQSGGARITWAGPVTFLGPTAAAPEGVYVLTPASGAKGEVKIEMPAEKGKLYVADCRLQAYWGGPLLVTFRRGDASQAIQPDDGHYLYPFKADGAMQTLRLQVDAGGGFYGCEITKVD